MEPDINLDALQIIEGASWFGLGTALGLILEYIAQGLIAARLGPSDYGVFSVGIQIFSFGVVLALLALPSAVTRFIPRLEIADKSSRISRILTTSLFINLISSVLAGTILFLLSTPIAEHMFAEPRLTSVLQLFALAVPSSTLVALVAGSLRGLKLSQQASLLTSTYERALRLGFMITFLLLGLELRGIVIAYLPASVLAGSLGVRFLHRSVAGLRFLRPSKKVAGNLLGYSWPLLVSQSFSRTRMAVQPLMLAFFLDAKAAGIYTVAVLIAGSFSMVLTAFGFLYMPVVSGISAGNELPHMRRLFRVVTLWGFVIVFPVSLLVLLLPETFLNLFGTQYHDGAWALRVLVVASLVNVGSGLVGATLLATDQTRTYLLIDLIGTVTSICLGLLLIPVMGMLGAAIAQLMATLFWNGLALFFVYRLYQMQPFNRHYFYVFAIGFLCLLLLYPVAQLVHDINSVAIIGLAPLCAGLTVLLLFRFRLLDADSQMIAGDFCARLQSKLAAARSHWFRARS